MSGVHGVSVCLHGCLTWTIIRMVGAVRCVLGDYALKTNHVGGLIRRESGAAPLMSMMLTIVICCTHKPFEDPPPPFLLK